VQVAEFEERPLRGAKSEYDFRLLVNYFLTAVQQLVQQPDINRAFTECLRGSV
jgi:hypothetical protein